MLVPLAYVPSRERQKVWDASTLPWPISSTDLGTEPARSELVLHQIQLALSVSCGPLCHSCGPVSFSKREKSGVTSPTVTQRDLLSPV